MIMEAMKTRGREANLWGICLHFLFTVTINRHRILNNKTCVTRRHWLKVKLSFFIKLNCVLFAQCIISLFEKIDPTEGLSLTQSCSCSRTTSQRSRMKYIEHNFPYFLHFPTLSLFIPPKATFSLVRHPVREPRAQLRIKISLKYGAPASRLEKVQNLLFELILNFRT